MAGIDKIYGTKEQHAELKAWLLENEKPIKCKVGSHYAAGKIKLIRDWRLPSHYLYDPSYWSGDNGPISIFPKEIDKWLLKKCPIVWVTDYIKSQYGII